MKKTILNFLALFFAFTLTFTVVSCDGDAPADGDATEETNDATEGGDDATPMEGGDDSDAAAAEGAGEADGEGDGEGDGDNSAEGEGEGDGHEGHNH